MSIVPLTLGTTVATTSEECDKLGGNDGEAVLIMNVDPDQVPPKDATEQKTAKVKSSNVTYDLRVGCEYRDLRDNAPHHIEAGKKIILQPGAALIIQTLESVRLPRRRFGIISPKVGLLQHGISNTFSKVDPGYDGPLLVTVFNLGQEDIKLELGQYFCGLSFLNVGSGAVLYSKPAKQFPGGPSLTLWERSKDWVQKNSAIILIVLTVVSIVELYLLSRK